MATIAPRTPASSRELDDARAGHARPGLREHARRALAEHEVERQIGQLGRQAGGERAVARADLDERERRRAARGAPRAARRSAASARARKGAAIGAVVNAPRAPEPRAARVEAVLGVVERALHEGAEADRARRGDALAQARRQPVHGVNVRMP